jgi:SWIM/SEC-C metal-binding protein
MPKLGTRKRPAVIRVRTEERAEEVLSICNEKGWQVIVGIEPDEVEDIADVEKLLNRAAARRPAYRVGRNAPCPCGSGKRYKSCCLRASTPEVKVQPLSPRFRFEPGSYSKPGAFMPSIACLEQWMPDQWRYHFVLVKPHAQLVQETDAVSEAEQDLQMAFGQGQPPVAQHMAESLKAQGYIRVEGFRIVD